MFCKVWNFGREYPKINLCILKGTKGTLYFRVLIPGKLSSTQWYKIYYSYNITKVFADDWTDVHLHRSLSQNITQTF